MSDMEQDRRFLEYEVLPAGIEYDSRGFFWWQYTKRIFHAGVFFLFLFGGIGGFIFAAFSPYSVLLDTKGRMILGFFGVFVVILTLVYGLFCLLNLGKRAYVFTMNDERVTQGMSAGQVSVAEFLGHLADIFSLGQDTMMGYESMSDALAYAGKTADLKELTVVRKYPKQFKIVLQGGRGRVKLQMSREQYEFVERFIRQHGKLGM